MKTLRVCQVITRMVRGGAARVVLELLRGLPREYRQSLACGPESQGALRSEAAATGTALIDLPELVREIRPASDLAAMARLGAIFRERRPHVVHGHTYKAGVLASVAARLAGVPAIIFTPHGHIFARDARIPGVPPAGWKLCALRRLTSAAQSCAHRVTALSEADLRDQLALGLSPPSRYAVVSNGIDIDRFAAPAAARTTEGDRPLIGAVGRFSAEKGHRYLVEALVAVRRRFPRARLVLVGYGELEPELREQAGRLGLGGAVEFAGERDSAEVLSSFDLFVQPSLYESQGMAILEAMASGRPVVATDVGGVRDAVREGETGLLVPPADAAALARGIVRLLEEPGLAAALAARGRSAVRERFSADRMVSAYARLYKDLLGRYNPPPASGAAEESGLRTGD
jgi:glycosyltransferase involved in cell wall biosynthesis